MANPIWFNRDEYLSSKLMQLRASGDTSYNNITALALAIEEAGMTPYSHFEAFGAIERTSPNQYFNANEYLAAKTEQMNALPGNTQAWTADTVAQAIADANLSIWSHFQIFGGQEGVNPSNSFDVGQYFDAKLVQLQTAEPDQGWTLQQVKDAFSAGGIDPITHFSAFGAAEALVVAPVPEADKVPADERAVITLTSATGEIIDGTLLNDTFNAVLGTNSTLNESDKIDGLAGEDTLNIVADGAVAVPLSATITNVEKINFANTGSVSGTILAGQFVGATHITQSGNAVAISGVAAETTVGFSNLAINEVAVGFTGTQGTIDLDEVRFTGSIVVNGTDLETLNISGNVTDSLPEIPTDRDVLDLDGTAAAAITTINLNVTSGTTLSMSTGTFAGLTTLDASASTGGIGGYITAPGLETILTGSGNDSIGLSGGKTDLTINLGAGDDRLTASAANSGNTMTLGEGTDVIIFNSAAGVDGYLRNVLETDPAALEATFASQIVSVTDFNGTADVLSFVGTAAGQSTLNGAGYKLTTEQVTSVAAAENLFDALGLAATATGINNWTSFHYDGNTYILQNDGTEGFNGGPGGAIATRGDGVIELTGFIGELTETNLVRGVTDVG